MPKIKRKHVSDFTTVNNAFLRDQTLGLTERGLLTTMLSLPDNWEFSGRGLSAILPDGRDRVYNSLRKLEEHGYLRRNKITLKGKIVDYEYEFCDCPVFPKKDPKTKTRKENVIPKDNTSPHPENPYTEFTDDNQYNKQSEDNLIPNNKKDSSEKTPSPSLECDGATLTSSYIAEPSHQEIKAISSFEEMREFVKKRIVIYDFCIHNLKLSVSDVNYVVDTISELLLCRKRQWIGGRYVSSKSVRESISKLNAERIAVVLRNIHKNAGGIKNYKQYLKASLINHEKR